MIAQVLKDEEIHMKDSLAESLFAWKGTGILALQNTQFGGILATE